MVDESIIEIIKIYIKELAKNNVNLSKVILYGSYASGLANADSDIDLMLISPDFDSNRDRFLNLIWKSTAISNYKIEPYPVGQRRFEDDEDSPLIKIAKTKGIEINYLLN